MPVLGAPLDLSKYEARNLRAHILGAAPSSPVTGQMYYNSGDNTLYWWDGSQWVSARGGGAAVSDATAAVKGVIQLAGDLTGTAASPQIASGAITDAEVAAANKDGTAGTASMRTLGNGAQQAAAGNDSRFTDARNPTGNAGGDLTGTYPNPQIAAGVITDADVAAANKDGIGSVPSLRTLGGTGYKAMPGVWSLADIGFNAPPIATINVNNQKIGTLAVPTLADDAATKGYVDSVAQGLEAKQSVRAASTANLTLSGTQTVDGVALVANDRVLVKDQTSQSANGIYVVAAGAWSRANDADSWTELVSAFTFVEEGTTNADNGFVCTVNAGGTLGSTNVTWTQFSGAGQITSGAGLTKSGNTLDVVGGAGIQVNADSVQVANDGITNAMLADGAVNLAGADVTGALPVAKGGTGQTAQKAARETGLGAAGYYSSATHGAGTSISITQATHLLRASRGLIVQVQDEATGAVELPDISVAANGDVTVTYGASVSANSKRVTVIG